MNRFRFRLESVLRYRKAQEEAKKREFGVVLGHLKREESRLNRIADDINQHDDAQEQAGSGLTSVRRLMHHFHYSRFLERKKNEQIQTVKKAVQSVDDKRLELVEATKKKKTLERLQERRYAEHLKEGLREEQALIDEIALHGMSSDRDA